MPRARVDPSIQRVEMNGFAFPLGVYPIDPIEPKAGFTMAFEPSDDGTDPEQSAVGGGTADDAGEWEEWPDRYVYDILIPATRVEPLVRMFLSMFPGRIYPILDFLGQDEWREVDPYVSYDLLGLDRFMEGLRRFRGFFYEDGLVGFGAMSEEPFLYIFVDEHKVVTVRAEAALKERVEAALAAFDLTQVDEIHSADSVTHEHRAVLDAPEDRADLLSAEEIVEVLRDEWRLVLNIDPDRNVDDEGNDLGITCWRIIIRYDPPLPEDADAAKPAGDPKEKTGTIREAHVSSEEDEDEDDAESGGYSPALPQTISVPPSRYAEVFLTADSLNRASDLAVEALEELLSAEKIEVDPERTPEPMIVQADRWGPEDFAKSVKEAQRKVAGKKASKQTPDLEESSVWFAAWLN
ncbi:MAG: hypothetical protein K2W85_09725 [Phycisphaerales bacterium]|nr:hypothetical protein [Phycisphaerales bacterium]